MGNILDNIFRFPMMKVYIYEWSLPRFDVVCLGVEARHFGKKRLPAFFRFLKT